jgi:hypothetical protein
MKDETLFNLSKTYNTAQFVSLSPDGTERFKNVHGDEYALLSRVGSVNIRTFTPLRSSGNPFVYGVTSADELKRQIADFQDQGYFVIVNETVDTNDGGVSGVYLNGLAQFSPNDTPRCVEKDGVCSLPLKVANHFFATIYGATLEFPRDSRIEFSVHPNKVGCNRSHVLVWEADVVTDEPTAEIAYPNNFSRHIGDKVFGLLLADSLGFDVPFTTVIGRNVAPFSFGTSVSTELWMRTSPAEPVAGKFTTQKGWVDPFALLQAEDPERQVVSVLSQDEVAAEYSGVCAGTDAPFVEGVRGFGDAFMLGADAPTEIDPSVVGRVSTLWHEIKSATGKAPRFEWADDGRRAYILQMHLGACESEGGVVVHGEPERWVDFDARDGLEALRTLAASVGASTGIVINGKVGVLSHFGDVLRKQQIPSRIK